MKKADPLENYRDYPHLIIKGTRSNWRRAITVSNGPARTSSTDRITAFRAPGMLDDDGELTTLGRDTIIGGIAATARCSKARYCVVWSRDACTWFDGDGRQREGATPPVGEMTDPWLNPQHGADAEWCWTIALPEGGEWSHLCVRRINRDLVEIAPGEPMTLASFDEPDLSDLIDPARELRRTNGDIAPPRRYRGQPVTGVRDGCVLLGPVQAGDDGIILRNAWPDDVREACERIAGMKLSCKITDAAWSAVDPEETGVVYVGVLKAA